MIRALLLLLVALLTALPAAGEIIYQKRSLYRNIIVSDEGDRICMRFVLDTGRFHAIQSCMFKADHDKLVFDYAKMTFAGLLLNPQPKRILIAGLGGGSIPRVLAKLYPEARIDIVEIDPAVVDVAREYFDFKEHDNIHIIVRDARVYVKQAALLGGQHYDYIVLDAFNGDYIPEHLMTKEFLEECKALLSDDGVLIANTFATSRLYHSESATYAAAFDWFLEVSRRSGNRIIVTGKGERPTGKQLEAAIKNVPGDLQPYDINLDALVEITDTDPEWRDSAPVLTDQYSPVNLLQGD